jgi:molecular chaperone DnaJ
VGHKACAPERGDDVRKLLALSLAEAVLGSERVVNLMAKRVCPGCEGVGAKPGTRVSVCVKCRGSGMVLRTQTMQMGARPRMPALLCRGPRRSIWRG